MIGTFEASGLYGWIRLVKLVSALAVRAHNLTSEAEITQKCSKIVENRVFGAVPQEIAMNIPMYSCIFLIGSA